MMHANADQSLEITGCWGGGWMTLPVLGKHTVNYAPKFYDFYELYWKITPIFAKYAQSNYIPLDRSTIYKVHGNA